MPGRELNLLCLDGGGVRGLSSLYILQKLMETVNPDDPPKPCDYFDMIGGTSTGGLLAIMLGRLRMDVDQCIEAYIALSDRVFKKKRHFAVGLTGRTHERFDSDELATSIKDVLVQQGFGEDSLLKEPNAFCKVFVCCTSGGTSTTTLLRSYPPPRGSSSLYRVTKIWEAARATSAASSFFDPIAIGPENRLFTDGGTGANNPIRQLWTEAKEIWSTEPLEENIRCIISIGTGIPSLKKFGKGIIDLGKSLLSIATETETTAELFHQEHSNLDDEGRYFRFNIPNGLADIGLEETSEKNTIVDMTDHYLSTETAHKRVKMCAKALAERISCKAIDRLPELPSYDASVFVALANKKEWQLSCTDPYDIFSELSTYDPERAKAFRTYQRCEGTATWILANPDFNNWLEETGSACLWLCGIVGCGKSIVMTTVVEAAVEMSTTTGSPAIHFFYDSSIRSQLKAMDLLESYVKQLLGYLSSINRPCPAHVVRKIKLFYGPKERPPDVEELSREVLLPLSSMISGVFYLVDGLDECEPDEVTRALNVLARLLEKPGNKILISSRDEVGVMERLPQSTRIWISEEDTKGDIMAFINKRIDAKMLERPLTESPSLLQSVKHELLAKAGGMFLWVRLQLDTLWEECFNDHDITMALAHLPRDLDETYRRCVDRIASSRRVYAHKILTWTCAALRPMHIEQMKEALAVNPVSGKLDLTKIPTSSFVIRSCSNLVVLDELTSCILPAHHSVRQFLFNETRQSEGQLLSSFKYKEAELELGELCIAHIASHNLDLHVQNSSNAPNYQGSAAPRLEVPNVLVAMVPGLLRRLIPKAKTQPTPLALPRRQPPPDPLIHKRFFFQYSKHNWALLTQGISEKSPFWNHLRDLALKPNEAWQLHPWRPIGNGRSREAHLFGLFGWAVVNQHIPLLQLVIERCKSKHPSLDFFNIPLFNHGGLYPLHVCVQSGNMQVMELLLQVCDPGKRDDEGCDAFHHAAEGGNEDIWSVLLRRHLACDFYADNASRTILHHAASGGNTNAMLFLIQKASYSYTIAAHPYSVLDSSGQNLLHIAALKGHYDVVLGCLNSVESETLSIFKAMCAADRSELTPIHYAVQRGDYQMARTFFEFSNIEENLVSKWLSEPGKMKLIWLASVAGASDILRLLNSENISIDMSLTSIPSDLDMDRLLPGMSALEHAIRTKNATASKALLEAGVSVGKLTRNPENRSEGWTLLMLAAASGSTNIVPQLMEYETFSIGDEPSENPVVSVRWIIKALNLAVQQDFHDISELLVSGVTSRILASYPPRTLSRAGGYASMHIRLDVTWVAMILHEPSAWITGARYHDRQYYLTLNRAESIRKYQPGFSWLHGNDRLDSHSGYALWHDKLFYLPPSSKPTPPFRNPNFVSVDIDFTVEHFGFTLLFGESLWPGTTKSHHYFMTQERPGLLTDIEILDRFREMEGVSSGFESAAICACKTSDTFGDIHWESRDMRFTRIGRREY